MSKIRQQRLRRFKQNEDSIKSQCEGLHITSFENLLMHSSEIERLIPILKLVQKHKVKMNKLIQDNELRIPAIDEPLPVEPNETLYNELLNRYDTTKTATKQFKFNNESKEKFRKYIFENNQDLIRCHIAQDALFAIDKFRNQIDISKYLPSQKHFDIANGVSRKQLKLKTEKLKEIEQKQEEPEPEPEIKKEKPKPKPKPKSKTELEPDSESDFDIEEFERMEKMDKDKNTPDDIKYYKKLFTKFWKQAITDDLSGSYEYNSDDEDEDNRHDKLVDYLIPRSKNIRGKNKELGNWASRNPMSLKKILLAIIKAMQKKLDKDIE
jgi:hypothetical protein